MLENDGQKSAADILDEELSQDELRELLRRIGQTDYGDESSKVKDVAEATGRDPVAIGRILADIRKESFEAKYGLKIEEHEERIERIEHLGAPVASTRRVAVLPPADELRELGTDDVRVLHQMVQERRVGTVIGIVVCLLAGIVLLITLVARPGGAAGRPGPTVTVNVKGVAVTGPMNGPFTATDHGKTRPATSEEAMIARTFAASVAASDARRGRDR